MFEHLEEPRDLLLRYSVESCTHNLFVAFQIVILPFQGKEYLLRTVGVGYSSLLGFIVEGGRPKVRKLGLQ